MMTVIRVADAIKSFSSSKVSVVRSGSDKVLFIDSV